MLISKQQLKDLICISWASLHQVTWTNFHTFTSTRLDDLRSLPSPTNHNGIEIYDNLRVFSGDGFGRQAFCCKIRKFASQKYAEKKINSGILKLCKSLVDIISICYSNCSQRTQKKFCAVTIHASCSAFSAKPLLKIPRR